MKRNTWSRLSRLLKKLSLFQSLSVLSVMFSIVAGVILGVGAAPLIIYHAYVGVIPDVSIDSLTIYLIVCAPAFLLMIAVGCFVFIAPSWYYQLFALEPQISFRLWLERESESAISRALWFGIPLAAWIWLLAGGFPLLMSTAFVLSVTALANFQVHLYYSGKLVAFWLGLPLSATLSLTTLLAWRNLSRSWLLSWAIVLTTLEIYALHKWWMERQRGSLAAQLSFPWRYSNEPLMGDLLRNIIIPFLKAASASAFGCFRSSVSWGWYLLAFGMIVNSSIARSRRTEVDSQVEIAVFLLLIIFVNAAIIALPKLHQSFTKCAVLSGMLLIGVLLHFSAVNAIPSAVMRMYSLGDYEARLAVDEEGRIRLKQQEVPYRMSDDGSFAVVDRATVISRFGTTSTFLYRNNDQMFRFTLPSSDVLLSKTEKH